MSLLIKALEKAEQGKTADADPVWSLQERDPLSTAGDDATNPAQLKHASQQAAATVFSAKTEKNPQRKSRVLWISVAILLAVAVVGMQFYAYLNALNKPDIIMARAPVTPPPGQLIAGQPTTQSPPASEPASTSLATEAAPANEARVAGANSELPQSASPSADTANTLSVGQSAKTVPSASAENSTNVFSSNQHNGQGSSQDINADISTTVAASPSRKPAAKSQQYAFGDTVNTSNAPVKITRNQPESGVNPSLLAAYQAYSNGDDATAQRNYRSVLQSDVRNVDALLGMAAIAARQGRNNDAMGWYGKVLEVEPRNSVAQSAMVNVLAQADPVSSESRIKNLIAQQPEAAHLHASLGNLYAEQKQWPAAQQAYFQAHHFAPNNAEYAFNLAVSLEQMGKPALALPYYQRALDLINSRDSGTGAVSASSSGIDRAQLESRIRQLQ